MMSDNFCGYKQILTVFIGDGMCIQLKIRCEQELRQKQKYTYLDL